MHGNDSVAHPFRTTSVRLTEKKTGIGLARRNVSRRERWQWVRHKNNGSLFIQIGLRALHVGPNVTLLRLTPLLLPRSEVGIVEAAELDANA